MVGNPVAGRDILNVTRSTRTPQNPPPGHEWCYERRPRTRPGPQARAPDPPALPDRRACQQPASAAGGADAAPSRWGSGGPGDLLRRVVAPPGLAGAGADR